jgi:mono/diheme cytochrome c family protein
MISGRDSAQGEASMQRNTGSRLLAGVLGAALALAPACGDSNDRPAPRAADPSEPEVSAKELAERGRSIYLSRCLACHGQDPSKVGAVGPAIAGSSLELLEAKVLRNEYPQGYTPQRASRSMSPLPYLEKELPAIHAFISGFQ